MAEAWKHHHTGHRQRLKAEFLARGLELSLIHISEPTRH